MDLVDPIIAASSIMDAARKRKAQVENPPPQTKRTQDDKELDALREWTKQNDSKKHPDPAQRKKWNQNRANRIKTEKNDAQQVKTPVAPKVPSAPAAFKVPEVPKPSRVVLPKHLVDSVTKTKGKIFKEIEKQETTKPTTPAASIPVVPQEPEPVEPEPTVPVQPASSVQTTESEDEGVADMDMTTEDEEYEEEEDPIHAMAMDNDCPPQVIHIPTGAPLVTIYLCHHDCSVVPSAPWTST